MKIGIESMGVPLIFYDTETKKYSCVFSMRIDGNRIEKRITE